MLFKFKGKVIWVAPDFFFFFEVYLKEKKFLPT